MRLNKLVLFFIVLLLTASIEVAFFFVVFFVFIVLFPAKTADGLHTVMPIGQMLSSILLAFLTSPFLFVFLYKKIKRHL